MAIRPSKIQTVADDAAHPARIQPSEMDPSTPPSGAPAHGDFYFAFAGTSPTRTLTVWVYDGVIAAWKDVAVREY